MAQSINQRIVLVGADEVKRALQDIAAAGQKSGNQLKTSFENSSRPVTEVTKSLGEARLASNNMRIALLEFEGVARGTFDGLASGSSILRVAAQQAGRFAQAISFAGGPQGALAALRETFSGIVTPSRIALSGITAVGAAVAYLLDRIKNDTNRVKEFGAVLHGLGLGTGVPGNPEQAATVLRGSQGLAAKAELRTPAITGDVSAPALLQSAKNLRDVALDVNTAFAKLEDVLRKLNNIPDLGLSAKGLEGFVRTGEKLNVVLGKGSAEQYISAISQIGTTLKPLQDIASKLRIPVSGFEDANTLIAEIQTHLKNTPVLFDPISIKAHELDVRFQEIADSAAKALSNLLLSSKEAVIGVDNDIKKIGQFSSALRNAILKGQESGKGIEVKLDFSGTLKELEDLRNGIHHVIGEDQGFKIEFDFSGVYSELTTLGNAFKDLANRIIGYFAPVTDAIQRALHGDIGALFRGDQPTSATSSTISAPNTGVTAQDLTAAGFAGGGIVRGPGSGISDSMLARISNGEFIVNAAATKANLPLLNAINSMNRPIRSNRGFATGGLIANPNAIDTRTRFTLVIEGRNYSGIDAPDSTVNALLKHAQTSAMISAGPSPGWRGGR